MEISVADDGTVVIKATTTATAEVLKDWAAGSADKVSKGLAEQQAARDAEAVHKALDGKTPIERAEIMARLRGTGGTVTGLAAGRPYTPPGTRDPAIPPADVAPGVVPARVAKTLQGRTVREAEKIGEDQTLRALRAAYGPRIR